MHLQGTALFEGQKMAKTTTCPKTQPELQVRLALCACLRACLHSRVMCSCLIAYHIDVYTVDCYVQNPVKQEDPCKQQLRSSHMRVQ